jgi:predicted DNA-binding ribbon-helix-helix protein
VSPVVKRSITLHGHRTSYSLEPEFHERIDAIARARGISLAALVQEIDENRPTGSNLSSALRVFVLNELLARIPPAGG